MRRWEVVVVAACVLLVLWAWWPRPQSDLPGPVPQERRRKLPTCKVPAEASPPPKLEVGQVGTIVSITAYITDFELSDNTGSAAVYDAAGNLLGVTIEKGQGEMTGGGEWVTFLFATPLDVADYENVRLAVFGDFEEVGYIVGGPDVTYDTGQVYSGPESWPAFIAPPQQEPPCWYEQNVLFSIYATGGNGERIGNQSASESGFYMAGQIICATGLLDTGPLEDQLKISGSDTIVLSETLSGYGPGFAASDVLAFEENLRHGGVIAPCDGRFIPPEPEEHCTNPHRWNG